MGANPTPRPLRGLVIRGVRRQRVGAGRIAGYVVVLDVPVLFRFGPSRRPPLSRSSDLRPPYAIREQKSSASSNIDPGDSGQEMAEEEVTSFLTLLATKRHVSASTQNQALSALLFLYRNVVGREQEIPECAGRVALAVRVPREPPSGEWRRHSHRPDAPLPPQRPGDRDLHARPRQRWDGRTESRRHSLNSVEPPCGNSDLRVGCQLVLLSTTGASIDQPAKWAELKAAAGSPTGPGGVDRLRTGAALPQSAKSRPSIIRRHSQPNHGTLTCESRVGKLVLQRSIRRGPKGEESRD